MASDEDYDCYSFESMTNSEAKYTPLNVLPVIPYKGMHSWKMYQWFADTHYKMSKDEEY